MTTAAGRLRTVLAVAGVGQFLAFLALSALPGGAVHSCVPALARLARAGLQLAWVSLPGNCAQAAQADARHLAIAAAAATVPLFLPPLLVTGVGALGWHGAKVVVRAVQRAVRVVLPVLPRFGARPATSLLAAKPSAPPRVRRLLFAPVVTRRGPPVTVLA